MSGPIFKPNLTIAPWLTVAQEVRAQGQGVTPFRLGLIVGRKGLKLPCPYMLQRSANLFQDGVNCGKRDAANAAYQGKSKESS